ncbi:FimV/HubP family polar landmark protein [Piscinibacter sp.]|uniref:FimV/HubP family polar landmark protein n=1 Tax=Piscinibacter sp. TaxID=1903157 RepID=UPI002F3F3CBD
MKRTSLYTGRFALTGVAAAALWLTVPDASALGLGRLAVQSALGETLRAEIDITSLTSEEAANLRVRVAPPESYRSAGVDYNPVLPGTQAVLLKRPDGRPYLRLTSDRAVQEPFVDVILELSWSTGRLVREYTLLFDPPTIARGQAPAPAAATAPVTTPAPTPAPATAAAPAPAPAPTAEPAPLPAAPRLAERRPAPTKAPASEAAAKPTPAGVDEYRVRPGDTLSRIASTTQRPGVSLDQMLVSLYRGNPQAFIESNMNRLKAGVVLAVPSAEAAKGVVPQEAREVIQAQSADFGAYRQKLAGAVPAAKPEGPARQAGGKVQATVEDRKQTAAPAPDKLTLSKGAASAKASAPEDRLSKEREKKDAATRVAELSKNVEELKKLSGAASAVAKAPAAAAPAPAPAPTAAAKPTITVPVTPPAVTPPPAPPPVPAPVPVAPTVAVKPAAPPASVALAAAPAASPVLTARPAASAPVAAANSRPKVPVAPVEEPGLLGSLLDDNPLALAVGAGLLALAGFGVYRYTRRSKGDSGETSFLESRLQPDSFFGASGGQRIDTRDASGASSSMSYSLSQLDAIGDVDPVAEADVYLAYGRDLQAEEILKEAMRSNPERLAIRTKLLEVYAKRRDTKGFEQLATQLFALTRGEGEDWAKAQDLGAQIDPDNLLYQPGGAPILAAGDTQRIGEPLGQSTMPQSVMPSASEFDRAQAEIVPLNPKNVDVDLDLGIDHPVAPAPAPRSAPAPVAAAPSSPRAVDVGTLNFDSVPDLPPLAAKPPAPAAPAASADFPMDFDLSAISLDLQSPTSAAPTPAQAPAPEEGELADIDFAPEEDDGTDPLARKLELAEEFRQIGDMEGARDLLQEVVSKADGALKAKAQGMLDALA